jgi:hypothetical protein
MDAVDGRARLPRCARRGAVGGDGRDKQLKVKILVDRDASTDFAPPDDFSAPGFENWKQPALDCPCYDGAMSIRVDPTTCLRYVALLERLRKNARWHTPINEPPGLLRVERGATTTDTVVHIRSKMTDLARTGAITSTDVVDASGHRREVYRPLLIYRWLSTDPAAPHDTVRAWGDALLTDLQPFVNDTGPLRAEQGASASGAAWLGLALNTAGRLIGHDPFIGASQAVFDRVNKSQRGDGSLLHAGRSDNPETQWFHELVILHALTSYAVVARDDSALHCALRNASFHQDETQPDHATTQPFGLGAAACRMETAPLADLLLHAATMQEPGGITGVSLMLLDDALYCLTSLARREATAVCIRVANRANIEPGDTTMSKPTPTPPQTLDAHTVSVLRCPLTRSPLRMEGDFLIAEVGGLAYPVRGGIPVLLVEEATLPPGVSSLDELRQKLKLA